MTTKNQIHPIGHGWDMRPNGYVPSSIIIHSTNNTRATSFQNELDYLMNSPSVSAHNLVGKNGEIALILPYDLRAWHSGTTLTQFLNSRSIGIEMHISIGQKPTLLQLSATAALVRNLAEIYSISREFVDTHRAVALPKGRKPDPEGFPDNEFYAWRNAIFTQTNMPTRVIGAPQSVTFEQSWVFLQRYKAPIDIVVAERMYTMAQWLDIDIAFVYALWRHETGQVQGLIGTSDLYLKSNNPGGIIAYGRWPMVQHNNRLFNKYESPQIGLMALLLHLKQMYGAKGLLDVETIIPVYAPVSDGNSPLTYVNKVKADMAYMASLRK